MSPGDRCVIDSGTYHETITPTRSGTATAPITYTAAPGARVVVDGADPVTGWRSVSGRDLDSLERDDPFMAGSGFATAVATGEVYQARLTINPHLTGNQVFWKGAAQIEAQWPYPGDDVSVPTLASAQSGTTDSLSDTALTQPAGFWKGAQLTAHNWFVSETGTVTDSQVGTITAAGLPTCVGLSPNQSTNYSLKGKLELLTHPGQWFYQASAHTLYLYSPDGSKPSDGSVAAKQRAAAIDLSGRSHITVEGLGIRGATAQTSAASTGVVLDGIVAHDISSDAALNPDPGMVTAPDGCAVLTAGETTSGILLKGRGNVLRNSLIDGSTGNGVVMSGTGNTVQNTTILHVDTLGSYAAGINVLGSDQRIVHNTIQSSGRSGINIDNKVAGFTSAGHTIAYNDISDYDNLVVDGGAIYVCCSVNLATTVIHHNQLHDPSPFAHTAPAPGVYLDNSTYNATVYDNVAWNRTTYGAVLINPNGQSTSGNRIYNNTSGTDTNVASTFGGTYSDTEIVNNIGVTGNDPGSRTPTTSPRSVPCGSPTRPRTTSRSPPTPPPATRDWSTHRRRTAPPTRTRASAPTSTAHRSGSAEPPGPARRPRPSPTPPAAASAPTPPERAPSSAASTAGTGSATTTSTSAPTRTCSPRSSAWTTPTPTRASRSTSTPSQGRGSVCCTSRAPAVSTPSPSSPHRSFRQADTTRSTSSPPADSPGSATSTISRSTTRAGSPAPGEQESLLRSDTGSRSLQGAGVGPTGGAGVGSSSVRELKRRQPLTDPSTYASAGPKADGQRQFEDPVR